MPRTRFPLPLGAIALIAVVSAALSGCAHSKEESPTPARPNAAASTPAASAQTGAAASVSEQADRGRIRGAEGARVWLIEISDFQCPYCKQWHDQVFDTIDKEYVQTGKVRLAYLNYPLSSIHPNARAAAEAAMCASVQGKFWELHESLFATQPAWQGQKDPMPTFDSLAVAAKVDPAQWRSCMTSHATAKMIDADIARSTSSGVQSTPSFFIGSTALAGAYPVDSFRVALDKELAKAAAKR
jgi:protein-disulfide isomerase